MTAKRISAFLDRIEGDRAVLLVGNSQVSLCWPAEGLPEGATEGSVLSFDIEIDEEATAQAKGEVEDTIRRTERGG